MKQRTKQNATLAKCPTGICRNGGERKRPMYILKSRGMAHSRRVRELVLSERGVTPVAAEEKEKRNRDNNQPEIQDGKGALGPPALRRRPDRAFHSGIR